MDIIYQNKIPGVQNAAKSIFDPLTAALAAATMPTVKRFGFLTKIFGNDLAGTVPCSVISKDQHSVIPEGRRRGFCRLSCRTGFTLIELLVVVLIIGILSAVALPQYQTAVDKSRYSTMMAAVRALKDAQEMYYMANGSYATSLEDLGVLPSGCILNEDKSGATCTNMVLNIHQSQIWGVLRSSPRNSYLMWYNYSSYPGQIDCYAYQESGERGLRLCKSLGGEQTTSVNGGCSNNCTIFNLP